MTSEAERQIPSLPSSHPHRRQEYCLFLNNIYSASAGFISCVLSRIAVVSSLVFLQPHYQNLFHIELKVRQVRRALSCSPSCSPNSGPEPRFQVSPASHCVYNRRHNMGLHKIYRECVSDNADFDRGMYIYFLPSATIHYASSQVPAMSEIRTCTPHIYVDIS